MAREISIRHIVARSYDFTGCTSNIVSQPANVQVVSQIPTQTTPLSDDSPTPLSTPTPSPSPAPPASTGGGTGGGGY